jgi:RNA polymerase sigma factor (sigma-70 family)
LQHQFYCVVFNVKPVKKPKNISTFQSHIIEKCKRNDRKAQMKLYNQYCNGMLVVALRFVKDTMEAEDIVQDAFIKAFSKLEQYRAEVTFGAWLKRIVINRCIDVLKSKRQRLIELEEHHLNVVDSDNESDWLVEDEVTIEDVKIAIENLDEKYRYVVMLYLIEGYDHKEISEILNISEVASRTQLLRGKQKLQSMLKLKQNGTRS